MCACAGQPAVGPQADISGRGRTWRGWGTRWGTPRAERRVEISASGAVSGTCLVSPVTFDKLHRELPSGVLIPLCCVRRVQLDRLGLRAGFFVKLTVGVGTRVHR